MTKEQEREIRLSISEPELIQLLETLSQAHLTKLGVKVNSAWLDEPSITADKTQFAEGLQTLRGYLFRLKGFLESTGWPREALTWVDEALGVQESLQQTMGE